MMDIDMDEVERNRAGSMALWAYFDDKTQKVVAVSLSWYGVGRFFRVEGKWLLRIRNMEKMLESTSSVFVDPERSIEFLDKWDSEDSELDDEIDIYRAPESVFQTYFPVGNVPPAEDPITAAGEFSECPPATSDIMLNLKNRNKAVKNVGYGPLNPDRPNLDFWEAKADMWQTTIEDAKTSRCANCAMFIRTSKMLNCIEEGLAQGGSEDSWSSIDAGDLGYCEALDFKCASARTCDAWVAGGPVTDKDEED